MSGSIHIKLEQSEATDLKKNTLFLEKELLESVKHLREYGALRKKEFILKMQVKKDVNTLINLISEIEATLPKEEAKEAIKKETLKKQPAPVNPEKLEKKATREKRKSDIEQEIDEIRRKLSMLE
jgi:hypothetical protein